MTVKIAVIGNCQVASFARCLRAFLQRAQVTPIPLEKVQRNGDAAEMAALAREADIIFTQDTTREVFGDLRTAELAQHTSNLVLFPKVIFTGFHPDAIGLIPAGRVVHSPTGAYHSQILMAAFASDMPLEQALELFCEETYDRLGYFEEFPKSRAHLVATGQSQGFDLAPAVEDWMTHGAFMHTFNHPKIRVMATMCRQALARTDLAIAEPDADPDGIEDVLARASRWPVYPEIARRLGLDEPFGFSKAERDGGEALSLRAFAEQSYAIYRQLPAEDLATGVRAAVLRGLSP
jgi:hypothetical protein